jgi:hypothetical protein
MGPDKARIKKGIFTFHIRFCRKGGIGDAAPGFEFRRRQEESLYCKEYANGCREDLADLEAMHSIRPKVRNNRRD